MPEHHHPFSCTKCWQEKWEELQDALGDRRAQLLLQLSGYAYRAKQYGHAAELAEECLAIYIQDSMRREDQADALIAFAIAIWELDRKDEAYAHLRSGLEIYREVNPTYAKVWENTLCWWLFQEERFEESMAAYLHTLELNRAAEDLEAASCDLLMIGSCHFHLQRYAESIPYFEEARTLAKKIKNNRHTAMADFNIGEAHVYLGNGFEGEAHCRKALGVFELYEHETYIAEAHKMIGMAQSIQGRYEDAVRSLKFALNGFAQASEKKFDEIVATQVELMKNLRALGRDDEAQALENRTSTIKELL